MDRSEEKRSVVVPSRLDGHRLDLTLVELCPGLSRTRMQALIREGRVTVSGVARTRPGEPVAAGEVLDVSFPGPEPRRRLQPGEEVPLDFDVLHEDEHLVVIDKPAGLVTHPNEKYREWTVADLADARFGPLPSVQGTNRPGIVHRLDRETSGVMVIGRTEAVLEELKTQFKAREVEKVYLAIVHGSPRFDSDWIESPIATLSRKRDRISVIAAEGEGRDAATFYTVEERFRGFALVSCRPKTGRTHQIRVHMASIGHALLFDKVYRAQGVVAPYPESAPQLGRQALHARSIRFTHPASGEKVSFEAPLPAEFEAVLAWLRAHRPENR